MQARSLRRDTGGDLYDLVEQRPVSIEELRDDLRAGRRFRARHGDTGADCTYEVLIEVLAAALPAWKLPADHDLGTMLGGLWRGAREAGGST
jgi:hypothetical protein